MPTPLPARNIFDGSSVPVTSTVKTAMGNLRDYLAALLGTTGSAADARSALGAAASGGNTDINSLAILRGFLSGCILSPAGATMNISAGTAQDSTNVATMALAAIAKTTSAWAVGTSAGGLDTGAIANSTWYHFYVIRRPDTGVVDALISLSATAPTMPANYTQFRRVASAKTNGSAQWTAFTQVGDDFNWSDSVWDINAGNPGTAAVTATLTVPTGVVVAAKVVVNVVDAATPYAGVLLSPLSATDVVVDRPVGLCTAFSPSNGVHGMQTTQVLTNTSAQIRYRTDFSSSGTYVNIRTFGWTDTRGRE